MNILAATLRTKARKTIGQMAAPVGGGKSRSASMGRSTGEELSSAKKQSCRRRPDAGFPKPLGGDGPKSKPERKKSRELEHAVGRKDPAVSVQGVFSPRITTGPRKKPLARRSSFRCRWK